MNNWGKREKREENRKLNCVLRNQIEIMQAQRKELYTYEHISRFGHEYRDRLKKRIKETEKILHSVRAGTLAGRF